MSLPVRCSVRCWQKRILDAPLRFGWPFIRSRKENQSRAVSCKRCARSGIFFQNQGAQTALCFDETSQEWLAASDVPCILSPPIYLFA